MQLFEALMPSSLKLKYRRAALAVLTLLPACYSVDSATSACRQNPVYCASVAGEETVVPLHEGAAFAASVAGTLRVLTPNTRAGVEHALEECVRWADAEVNRLRFGGRTPSRSQCQELIPTADPCGRPMTRGMQLGSEKHQLAFQCAHDRLSVLVPGRFSLEPRYRYNQQTGERQLLGLDEVRALRQKGCGGELAGTLVPDVVIHSGDPLNILAVYDFKFPCPSSNEPRWSEYPANHPYEGLDQGDIYSKAFGVVPHRVSPGLGVE